MAISYNKKKVDYTQTNSYKTTYQSTKDAYNETMKSAQKADDSDDLSSFLKYTSTGAGIGAAVGTVGGIFVGGLVGAGAWVGRQLFKWLGGNSKTDEANTQFFTNINNNILANTEEARKLQVTRNQNIVDAKYLVNKTQSDFVNTYGQDSFNMLEATINTLFTMDSSTRGIENISSIIGGLQKDNIVTEIETRLMQQDYVGDYQKVKNKDNKDVEVFVTDENQNGFTKAQVDKMYSTSYSLASLGQQYVEYLYNSVVHSDTAVGLQAESLSQSERYELGELDDNIKSLVLSNQQKFSELFLNERSSNISAAQNLGEAEAAGGASGIKASKSARTSVNATRMSQDIANASYAIMLNSYQKQLEASIASGQLSREKVLYSYQNQMYSLKQQIKSSFNESLNSYLHGAVTSIKNIGEAEEQIDEYTGQIESDKQFLKDQKQSTSDDKQYIYSTHTATA